MAGNAESLGKAVLDLEANLGEFLRNMQEGERASGRMESSLDAVSRVARVAEIELNRVKMDAATGASSREIASRIERSVGSVGRAAMEASRHLEQVKLEASNAVESSLAGDVIDRKLKDINRNANETRRSLDRVKLAGGVPGRSGVGVGIIGSGYGRVGALGAAVAAGTLAAPSAGPATAGLLAAITPIAASATGALGTLILAFHGLGDALKGDQDAYDKLAPAQQKFVTQLQSLDGWLKQLEQTAASGVFAGLSRGLHAAMSPGTLSAISDAVREFGTAIGDAGAAWGRYFGSAEFQQILGPLMQSGARNMGVLSDAVLSLFDALGVLGRAAIPFTNWLNDAIAKGGSIADSWLHAKEASGALGHAMMEAQTSLRIVGGLVVALGNAVAALGAALYPVSQLFVRDVSDGLNALASAIRRNQDEIRNIISGALNALVATIHDLSDVIKEATPLMRSIGSTANTIAHAFGGWKTVIEALIAFKFASALSGWTGALGNLLGTAGAKGTGLRGAATESSTLSKNLQSLAKTGALSLGITLLVTAKGNGVGLLERVLGGAIAGGSLGGVPGALIGATIVAGAPSAKKAIVDSSVSASGSLPVYKDGKWVDPASKTPVADQAYWNREFTQSHPASAKPANGSNPYSAGADHRIRRGRGSKSGPVLNQPPPTTSNPTYELTPRQSADLALAKNPNSVSAIQAKIRLDEQAAAFAEKRIAAGKGSDALVAQLKNIYAEEASLRSQLEAIIKKNKPKSPPVIPPLASRAEALASTNASKAGAAGGVGATAERYIRLEITDLNTAVKALKTKYASATGKARTQLFAAITSVQNKIRSAQSDLKKALAADAKTAAQNRADRLQFALDQAKDAVAAATEGTSAYAKAVAAEEKLLRAQIAFDEKLGKNSKLSLQSRQAAIREATADRTELKNLLKKDTVTAGGRIDEQQFLSDFGRIVSSYAPNAFPTTNASSGEQHAKKTNTHLYDIKHETREQTKLLRQAGRRGMHPVTSYGQLAAGAVNG